MEKILENLEKMKVEIKEERKEMQKENQEVNRSIERFFSRGRISNGENRDNGNGKRTKKRVDRQRK
jgi:hypothetical protein